MEKSEPKTERVYQLPDDKKELLDLVSRIRHREYGPDNSREGYDIAQMQEDLHTLSLAVLVLLHPSGVR